MQHALRKGKLNAVTDSAGGELVSLLAEGVQYVWWGDPAFWTGRAPVLFPIVGALRNDQVTIGGTTYSMTKHGFARKSEFRAVEAGEEHVIYELCDSAETRKSYPFCFRLTVTHRLLEEGFETVYTVTNRGKEAMPFCVGGHAGFPCPLEEGASFEDYRLVFDQIEEPQALITDRDSIIHPGQIKKLDFSDPRTLPLRYKDFQDDVLIFDNIKSQKVSLLHGNQGLEFSFDGFPALGVWTPPGKNAPFLCLEPWLGLPAFSDEDGMFEHKPYAVSLQSGESRSVGYRMKIIGTGATRNTQ